MESDNYQPIVATGADYDQPSFEPVSAFSFALNDPRWSDREIRLIAKSDVSEKTCKAFLQGSSIDSKDPEAEEGSVDNDGRSVIGQFDVEVTEISVNSVILAKQSPFFRSLLGGNDFKEANAHTVDIHINPEEWSTFITLIECIYTENVTLTKVDDLIALWVLSERFLVHHCSQLCLRRLRDMPLDLEQAIRIHEAADISNPCGDVRALIEPSTHFLIRHFKKLSFVNCKPWASSKHLRESNKELLKDFVSLSQPALKALLASDNLEVDREEIVFYALILWVKEKTFSVEETQLMMSLMVFYHT